MGIFIFSYHVDNEAKIKELGDEYSQYHNMIVNMDRSEKEYPEIAKKCEKIIMELRKIIVKSEVIYKNEQEQLNKSIQVAMKAQDIIKKNNPDAAETESNFDPDEIMKKMEEHPEMFEDIAGEMDESYDINKLKSGFNKVMDLMQEIGKDENLRMGMFNIPD